MDDEKRKMNGVVSSAGWLPLNNRKGGKEELFVDLVGDKNKNEP